MSDKGRQVGERNKTVQRDTDTLRVRDNSILGGANEPRNPNVTIETSSNSRVAGTSVRAHDVSRSQEPRLNSAPRSANKSIIGDGEKSVYQYGGTRNDISNISHSQVDSVPATTRFTDTLPIPVSHRPIQSPPPIGGEQSGTSDLRPSRTFSRHLYHVDKARSRKSLHGFTYSTRCDLHRQATSRHIAFAPLLPLKHITESGSSAKPTLTSAETRVGELPIVHATVRDNSLTNSFANALQLNSSIRPRPFSSPIKSANGDYKIRLIQVLPRSAADNTSCAFSPEHFDATIRNFSQENQESKTWSFSPEYDVSLVKRTSLQQPTLDEVHDDDALANEEIDREKYTSIPRIIVTDYDADVEDAKTHSALASRPSRYASFSTNRTRPRDDSVITICEETLCIEEEEGNRRSSPAFSVHDEEPNKCRPSILSVSLSHTDFRVENTRGDLKFAKLRPKDAIDLCIIVILWLVILVHLVRSLASL